MVVLEARVVPTIAADLAVVMPIVLLVVVVVTVVVVVVALVRTLVIVVEVKFKQRGASAVETPNFAGLIGR